MPAPDPTLPDSIILGQFSGLKNTVAPERLGPDDLERATNVDIDDSGQLRRRRGYAWELAGSWHSIKGPLAGKTYGVKDGYLGIIRPQPAFFSLGVYVGSAPVTYTEVDGEVYFSSADASGVISQSEAVSPWGHTGGQGKWLSPVLTPTETLGEVGGTLLGDPPKARCIEAFRGRIYLAEGKTIWRTELYRYHYVDRTKGFYQFEHEITLLMAVDDGLYVGTTGGLYFLSDEGLREFGALKLTQVITSAVLPGSGVVAPINLVHPAARSQPVPDGAAVMFMTDDGVYAGFNGGECYNLTQTRVLLPDGVSAAGLFRQDQGVNAYVAAVDSAGAPTSTARIGDYIDAEVRRFVPLEALPTPIAGFNFRTNTGSIDGVAKTFADMFVKADPDGLDPVIVPGEGLQVVSTSNADQIDCWLKSTPALFAATTREFVGVVEFTTSTTGNPQNVSMAVDIASTDFPAFAEEWLWSYQSDLPYNWDEIKDSSGSCEAHQTLASPQQGHYKDAYMFCEELLAASINGGVPLIPVGTPQANLSANAISVYIRAWSIDDVSTTTVTLHSITFYPELTPAMLPRLSAL